MFSFEWKAADRICVWELSKQRLPDSRQAAEKAAEWLAICWENDYSIEVRLIKIG